MWATHQGRGLSWREGQGHGSPVAAFFFFKSRRMRRDKTPHSVDNPWSTQRGRRYQSSLSGPVVRPHGLRHGCQALSRPAGRSGRLVLFRRSNRGSSSRYLTISASLSVGADLPAGLHGLLGRAHVYTSGGRRRSGTLSQPRLVPSLNAKARECFPGTTTP